MFKTVLTKLSEFFTDGTGALSAMRLSQHMIVFCTLFLWAKACAASHWTMVPLDATQVTLVATALGAKTIQSFAER